MRDYHSIFRQGAVDCLIVGSALMVITGLGGIVAHTLLGGLAHLDLRFILEAPLRSGRSGGIGPIIVSTMIVTGIALAVAVPVGCGIALLLAELLPFTSRIGRVLRLALAMLAAVPSIVFGLVGNALFCDWLGLGFSLLSGGLTLACMVMPIIAYVVEQSLRGLPSTLRASAHALGIPLYRIVLRIVLPAVAPGIIGGIALGFGRAVAESAALVFTSGHVDRMPGSLLDSGRTLAVHILDLSMNVPGGESRAATTSLVLLIAMVLVLGGLGLVRIALARKLGAIQ